MQKKAAAKSDRKAVAILISDIHYSLSTLALADAALRQAIDKAAELQVPLLVSGDLHDTKALLRAECVKIILDTFEYAAIKDVDGVVLVGNHDLVNEKGKAHSLEFLRSHVAIVQEPAEIYGFYLIPYQANAEDFKAALDKIPPGATVIMHQGVTGAESGEYVYDKSAIPKEWLADYRVISGHYHKAQDIKCGRPQKGAVGLMSYIGSPYTVTFAEANDGPKGFQVLYDDGLMEQVPTNLRKHLIAEVELSNRHGVWGENWRRADYHPGDLLWVKLRGTTLELDALPKREIASLLQINHLSFKLDKIVTDAPQLQDKETENKSNSEIMDILIDRSGESDAKKAELKALWRTL